MSVAHSGADWRPVVSPRVGQEPLLYLTVLLLSLQFGAAVAFIARDPSTKPYRLDAVHLAIALLHHQLLDVSSQDAGVCQPLTDAVHAFDPGSPSPTISALRTGM